MNNHPAKMRFVLFLGLILIISFLTSCGNSPATVETMTEMTDLSSTAQPDLPDVLSVDLDTIEVPKYESLEITLGVDAEYSNPYDAREITIDGVFTGPDGTQMEVPGFWDGDGAWKLRFTPSREGIWSYSIIVKDINGESVPTTGEFSVTASDRHGWIIPGNVYDPDYSPHYLIYHDGTPFYGVGHCDALNILVDGFDAVNGVKLFDNMKAANENYVVWWPLYSNSFIGDYANYSVGAMKVIDLVIKDAQKKDVLLVFTIWDHPELRDDSHAWGTGNWNSNGFSRLSDINSFFNADEPWAWQENLYRYIIARWGYSPAIGMWLTVSEINGTNAYTQTDSWHKKVNNYFVENDPYRHPTTASGSGEVDWPTGHAVMDIPQVHLYDFDHGAPGDNTPANDVVGAAAHVVEWTQLMLRNADKPNWIGEFGTPGDTYYPELFHNSNWAALASGASMTPAEWNSGGAWNEMTPGMYADIERLSQFVQGIPLAQWNPSPVQISFNDEQIRGWGVAGTGGGLFWVQDFSLEGKPIDVVRASMPRRTSTRTTLQGVVPGSYSVIPYDTWQGVYLESIDVDCSTGDCILDLPEFKSDMAFKLILK